MGNLVIFGMGCCVGFMGAMLLLCLVVKLGDKAPKTLDNLEGFLRKGQSVEVDVETHDYTFVRAKLRVKYAGDAADTTIDMSDIQWSLADVNDDPRFLVKHKYGNVWIIFLTELTELHDEWVLKKKNT